MVAILPAQLTVFSENCEKKPIRGTPLWDATPFWDVAPTGQIRLLPKTQSAVGTCPGLWKEAPLGLAQARHVF
jgi:hypothetical protein